MFLSESWAHEVEVRREFQRYDNVSGRLLWLASSDLLLVHRLADGMGSAEPCRNLLAASPCIVSGCVPFRHGHRLPRQLG